MRTRTADQGIALPRPLPLGYAAVESVAFRYATVPIYRTIESRCQEEN